MFERADMAHSRTNPKTHHHPSGERWRLLNTIRCSSAGCSIIAIALAGLISSGCGSRYGKGPAVDADSVKDFIREMCQEGNQIVVQRDYFGRPIRLSGKVTDVAASMDGSGLVVRIDPGFSVNWTFGSLDVMCDGFFPKSQTKRLETVRIGEQVTLYGRLDGFLKRSGELAYLMLLNPCRIE